MNERAIAEMMSSLLPAGRLNGCFESDAEVIRLGRSRWLFTTDEFSAEDLFRETEPYLMGWNVAAGAVSDIYASGGVPLYYAHALTAARNWDETFLRKFGQGVRDVLLATGAQFIGGDCGRARDWRCTATVIGRCVGEPLMRTGAVVGDAIYLSGRVGTGNLEAALTLATGGWPDHERVQAKATATEPESPGLSPCSLRNHFPLRNKESALLRQFASACIDTSDGVWSALNTLADLNECGYEVAEIPYVGVGLDFCARVAVPKTLLFLGGCGEYELLFTVRPDREEQLLARAACAGMSFYRLGTLRESGRRLCEDGAIIDLNSLRIDPRDYEDPREYAKTLIRWRSAIAAQPSVKPGKPADRAAEV